MITEQGYISSKDIRRAPGEVWKVAFPKVKIDIREQTSTRASFPQRVKVLKSCMRLKIALRKDLYKTVIFLFASLQHFQVTNREDSHFTRVERGFVPVMFLLLGSIVPLISC